MFLYWAQLFESWNQWLHQAASSSSCRAAPQDRAPPQALGVHWASLHCPPDHSHYLTVLVCLGVTGGFSTCESSFIQWHRLLFLSLVCCKQSAFSILSWLSDISHLHVFSLQPSHFVCAYWQFHTQLTGNKQHHYHTFDFLPIGTVYSLSCCSSASFQSVQKLLMVWKCSLSDLHVTAVESFLLTNCHHVFDRWVWDDTFHLQTFSLRKTFNPIWTSFKKSLL